MEGFKGALQAYYSVIQLFAERLMRVFAEALGLEREYFNPFIRNLISALRAIYYLSTKKNKRLERQTAGVHKDYRSLNILLPMSETSGLQVFHNKEWVAVPNTDSSFVVSLSDLMALWTSSRWQ